MIQRMLQEGWEKDKNFSYRLAYLLSRVFDTPIMAFEIFLVFMFRVQVQFNWLAILIIGNLVLPIGHLMLGYYTKRISDLDITKREERTGWYTGLALSWTLTLAAVIWFSRDTPELIVLYQIWLTIFGVMNAAITYYWKISAHAMLSTSLVLWLTLLWNPWYFLLLGLFVPLICWARFRTNKHTIPELIAGALLMLFLIPSIWLLISLN